MPTPEQINAARHVIETALPPNSGIDADKLAREVLEAVRQAGLGNITVTYDEQGRKHYGMVVDAGKFGLKT